MPKYYFFCLLFILSCSNISDDKTVDYWGEALIEYENNNYDACVIKLTNIIEKYPNSDYAPKSYYLISEIYLNEYKEYNISIDFLNKIIDNYPSSIEAKKSLFTIGYIYANYIDQYTDAFYFYNMFMENHPTDALIPSVEYELENLKPLLNKVDSLISN